MSNQQQLTALWGAILLLYSYPPIYCQEYNVRHYTVSEGLSLNSVYSVEQDENGRLWLGCYGGGLNLFDGQEFSVLDSADWLENITINKMYNDREGNMWLAGADGLWVYDGERFIDLENRFDLKEYDALDIDELSDGQIIITREKDVLFFDEFNLIETVACSGEQALGCSEVFNNQVFVGSRQGIFKIEDSQLVRHKYINSRHLNNTGISSMAAIGEELWIGGYSGMFYLDAKNRIHELTDTSKLGTARIFDITQTSDHKVWLATTEGAFRFSGHELELRLDYTNGLNGGYVFDIFEDTHRKLWLGSFNGLYYFANEGFRYVVPDKSRYEQPVFAVNTDNDRNIWAGDIYGNIYVLNDDAPGEVLEHKKLSNGSIQTIHKGSSGDMVITTNVSGIFHMKGGLKDQEQTIRYQLMAKGKNAYIFDSYLDKQNSLWVFGGNIVAKINLTTGEIADFSRSSLLPEGDYYSGYVDSDGYLWVTCWEKGVMRFRIENDRIVEAKKYCEENLVFGKHALTFFEKDGALFIAAASDGLFAFRDRENLSDLVVLNKKNGLKSETIFFAGVDEENNIWLGQDKGVQKIVLDEYFNIIDDEYFDAYMGYKGIESNHNAFHADGDRLYFGTVKNLTIYEPYKQKNQVHAFPLLMKDVKVHYKSVQEIFPSLTKNKWQEVPQHLTFAHDQSHLMFEFGAVHFDNPKQIEYSWKLDGLDKAWHPYNPFGKANYSNIPPGTYRFMLKARNNIDGSVAMAKTTEVKILAPFWQTGWFQVFSGVWGLFFVAGFIKWRERRLQRQNEVLEKIVSRRTRLLRKEKEQVIKQQHLIKSSISYARRIQAAILPPMDQIRQSFPEVFVLFRPKDLVSGDFYWFKEEEDRIWMAVADCTGHGVPGGFMSIISHNLLEEAYRELDRATPDSVLNYVRRKLPERMSQNHSDVIQLYDGMDISLVCIDKTTGKLEFSGAQNPVYIVREGRLYEIKGDRIFISSKAEDCAKVNFDLHTFYLEKGDQIYLFSDGYFDQIGGPQMKRFKSRNFKQLLLRCSRENMEHQKEVLESEINEWIGDFEQIDDILLLGIKY